MTSIKGITSALLSLLLVSVLQPTPVMASPHGLYVVVTFTNLLPDIKLLACEYDTVHSLVPPGVDPHDYELRPSDVNELARADLIISTAHAPFERVIHDRVASGEISSLLVEIPHIEGMRILKNPVTGQPNYHMPIYDPENYLMFMRYLKDVMSELNPSCSHHYEESYQEIVERIRDLESKVPEFNATAIAVTPVAQYAVEWTGIKVKHLLQKERGVPATPPELIEMRKKAMSGDIDLMILVGKGKTQLNLKAIELAEESGIPYITVPSPLEVRSIPDKLGDVVRTLSKVNFTSGRAVEYGSTPLIAALLMIAVSLLGTIYLLVKK